MPDPYDPGWRPNHTGPDESVGDVGTGPGFGADLYQLYRAGRLLLPEIAMRYYELATALQDTQGTSLAAFTAIGDRDPAHRVWIDVRDELQEVFRTSSINFRDTGEALVEIADRYARTDSEAADRMADLLDQNDDQYQSEPLIVPDAPAPEYVPTAPGLDNRHPPDFH
jgi:hypothetical protein